jgi:transcriptional regulator with XRE-family HTH domain
MPVLVEATVDMRALRERAGVRAEVAAATLGISISTIRNWEAGRSIPTLGVDKVRELLTLYGCTFDELEQAVEESRAKQTQGEERA